MVCATVRWYMKLYENAFTGSEVISKDQTHTTYMTLLQECISLQNMKIRLNMKIKWNYINSQHKGTHNPYQTPDQFVINPEEDKWLTEEASCVAHNIASHYMPLQLTVLLVNVFYVMSLFYQHNEIISLSSPHMYTYIHTYIYTLMSCTL